MARKPAPTRKQPATPIASDSSYAHRSMNVGRKRRRLNVRADPPDIRDRYYDAPLIQLEKEVTPPDELYILDQGQEGACTGFGLAAVINLLLARSGRANLHASPRMLYEMAKKHDEWPGQDYDGSSLRGAIRGWHSMGVCTEESWPYKAGDDNERLTIARAKEARNITLGAYFRLRPNLPDYHAALCQAEAVYVSANVHKGWNRPKRGVIEYTPGVQSDGGHAFVIVGYDQRGFWIQNSWGDSWGKQGLALWTYEDWLDHVVDAWAVRLALPVPQIFGRVPGARARQAAERPELFGESVKRGEIAGHFVHVDDGKFADVGEYWSSEEDVHQTAELIAETAAYDHLLIFAHGGLNSPEAAARRIRAFKEPFKRNRVYPYSIMYDTGLGEEIKDLLLGARERTEARAGAFSDFTDHLIEDAVRKPVTPIWEEMKRDARVPFGSDGAGTRTIRAFIDTLPVGKFKVHLVGHSTGAVLLGHLLAALDRQRGDAVKVASCSLLAPACTMDFFHHHYAPRLGKRASAGKVHLPLFRVYDLSDQAERDDNVAEVYRKSLLYLVSRALERKPDQPLLGLQKYCIAEGINRRSDMSLVIADPASAESRSTSHGGFDNDLYTMNGVMQLILGKPPSLPFTPAELKGY